MFFLYLRGIFTNRVSRYVHSISVQHMELAASCVESRRASFPLNQSLRVLPKACFVWDLFHQETRQQLLSKIYSKLTSLFCFKVEIVPFFVMVFPVCVCRSQWVQPSILLDFVLGMVDLMILYRLLHQ